MNAKSLSRVALAVGAVMLAERPAPAQTVAPGPYYAVPSWDQTIACSTPANCPRFVVLSNMANQAVLDRETGLVWERTPRPGNFNYQDATVSCALTGTGDRFGWRLPSIHELQSLLVRKTVAPGELFLPDGHPFIGVTAGSFWSHTRGHSGFVLFASTVGNDSFASITSGPGISFGLLPTLPLRTWCVRGGGPIAEY